MSKTLITPVVFSVFHFAELLIFGIRPSLVVIKAHTYINLLLQVGAPASNRQSRQSHSCCRVYGNNPSSSVGLGPTNALALSGFGANLLDGCQAGNNCWYCPVRVMKSRGLFAGTFAELWTANGNISVQLRSR